MKHQGNVKSLALGGRPQNGPMQSMGGVKAGQAVTSDMIEQFIKLIQFIVNEATKNGKPTLTKEEFEKLNATAPQGDFAFASPSLGMNFRNAYYKDDSVTPQQFIYEPADCRLFYTAENALEPKTSWTSAVRAVWKGGQCVDGSTTSPSGTTGAAKPSGSSGFNPQNPTETSGDSPDPSASHPPFDSGAVSVRASTFYALFALIIGVLYA